MRVLQLVLGGVTLALLLTWVGTWVLSQFNLGDSAQKAGVQLLVEDRGTVRVSLDGGEFKEADHNVKLYAGDKVSTTGNTAASLQFFDGSFIRLAEHTDVLITESKESTNQSQLSLQLENGTIWLKTADAKTFTGSIARHVGTNSYSAEFPSGTEAIVKNSVLTVFTGDGIGATVAIRGSKESVYIGEGQSFVLGDTQALPEDLYALRSAIDPQAISTPHVSESRNYHASLLSSAEAEVAPTTPTEPVSNEVLTVSTPTEGSMIYSATVTVEGTANEDVRNVQVNGYGTEVDPATRRFSAEIALPDKDEVPITIEAIGNGGETLAEVIRTVKRDLNPPDKPTFLSPAAEGETYRTPATRLEIRGTAPEGTVGIIVNDYRLQFFEPGDTTWSYLANVAFDNLEYGENTFEAIAINQSGLKSEPARMTIIIGEGEEGIVSSEDEGEDTPPAEEVDPDPGTLPDNDPLAPGTLSITGPSANSTSHNTGEVELLIEGYAPPGTENMYVNDYRLRLFEPRKGIWNYIASVNLGTMKRGQNMYTITARNEAGQIIDQVRYVINFNPRNRGE